MALASGTRLAHYEILALIGSGGMGEVYKARDTRLDRTVAIKIVSADVGGDATMRERLLREARAASSLNHPHICTVHDVHDDSQPFIAMEWIDGESLLQRLAGSGASLPLPELLRLASQIADALDTAHSSGIVHRDLKPANLFVTRRGDAKIVDFGLAQVIPDAADVSANQKTMAAARKLTNRGEAVGTVSYMAPEQARGERVDSRSDLFSFGVVLYEMATGRSAFAAPTTALTFDAILNRQPPSSRTINSDVPPALDAIIGRLLSKDPASRYQSARILRDELQTLVETLRSNQSSGRAAVAPSIAVLPFTNLSPEPENEYIADGITEEIINTLAQLKGLQVAARTSSFSFKGKTPDLAEVAAKLHVAHVLTGSVRKAGSRLRVTAQLINAHDAFTVWSERYDRQTDDIFQIQDEIAMAIAQKLRVALMDAVGEPIAKRGTENLEAYELYLKGRFFVNQRGVSIAKGLECYERAVALDSGYGLAHGGIAIAVALVGFYGYAPFYEALPKARRAAQNALASGHALAEAHAVLQFISFCHDWDWAQTEREFSQVVALNDKLPVAHQWYSLYLSARGRLDEGVAAAARVIEIDPLSAIAHAVHAFSLFYAGRFEDVIMAARRAEQLDPQVWVAEYSRGPALCRLGRFDEAVDVAERCVQISERHHWPLESLEDVYRRTGRHADAIKICEELLDRARQRYVPPVNVARALGAMERVEEAVAYWQRAYREHDSLPLWNHWRIVPPLFACDSRFADVMRRVGLAPGQGFVQ
jgi:serine/threonine-protein kinase